MNRRRFFQVSALGSVGLMTALFVGEHTYGRALSAALVTKLSLSVLSDAEAVTLRAVALRVLDGAIPSPATDGGAAICQFADRYLQSLPTGLRRDLRALLHLVELYPLLTLKLARFHLGQATGGRTLVEQGVGKDIDLGTSADSPFEGRDQPDAFHRARDHPRADDRVAPPTRRQRVQQEGVVPGGIPQHLDLAASLLKVRPGLGGKLKRIGL